MAFKCYLLLCYILFQFAFDVFVYFSSQFVMALKCFCLPLWCFDVLFVYSVVFMYVFFFFFSFYFNMSNGSQYIHVFCLALSSP